MRRLGTLSLLPLWIVAAGCGSPPPTAASSEATRAPAAPASAASIEAAFPAGTDQIVHRRDAIEWGPCPPGPLEGPGCRMAVLEGNPRSKQLFTVRFATTEPFVVPPHTHPRHERVTVLEGALHVGFGETEDRSRGTRFGPGDYYVNRSGAAHFVWSDEPMVLQINGVGPWAIEPVEHQD